jgi:chromate transporter
VVAATAFAGYLAGVHELVILVVAGALTALWVSRDRFHPRRLSVLLLPLTANAGSSAAPVSQWRLLAVFLEIGSVLYGSGYVLIAFLQRTVVDDLGWLTRRQLLDAVTVGQVTPGPVFTTATFVGWQIDGPTGAAVATVGIFAPSFVFVALLGRIVPWMRARPTARAFLTGLTTASLGLMAGVLVELSGDAITDLLTAATAAVALTVLIGTRVNTAWLIGAGVLVGGLHALSG